MAKLEKTQKSLLIVNVLRVILDLFTSTFLTSHILSLSPDNIFGTGLLNIGIFYVSQYIVFFLVYFTLSYFIDKSNRVSFLRIGILINGLLLVLLAFFGETISSWIVLAGAIVGVSQAFYFASYNVMKNELNGRVSIKTYNLSATILSNIAKMIVPTILGYLIEATTYSYVAVYVVIIAIIQFITTFFINSIKPTGAKFEPFGFIKFLQTDKESWNKIKYTYYNSLIAGVKTTYSIIVTILTIYTFKTDLSLGVFTSIFSLLTMGLLMLYKKGDSNPKVNKKVIYCLLGVFPVICCLAMVFWLNNITLVIFNFSLTVIVYFTDYLGGSERDAIIKNLNKYEYIAEHQTMVEGCLVAGRIVAFAVFSLVSMFASLTAFKILLVCIVVLNPLKFYYMYMQRKVRKEFELKNANLVATETEVTKTDAEDIKQDELDNLNNETSTEEK